MIGMSEDDYDFSLGYNEIAAKFLIVLWHLCPISWIISLVRWLISKDEAIVEEGL